MATKISKVRSRNRLSGKERSYFTIYAKLFTDEVFSLKNVYNEMKIAELKKYMEFATGIPIHMQRLSYLDEGDLLDNSDVKSNDIVPGGTLQLRVWSSWNELVQAAAENDAELLFKLGITSRSKYKTPNGEYMHKRAKKAWFEERAFVALYIAAHRGHAQLCRLLIDAGTDMNACTPLGRCALHVAAAQGHGHIVDVLLEKGADIDAADDDDNTALTIAEKFGHKSCARHLFLFRWQQRAKKSKPQKKTKRMAHQVFDSSNPIWLKGNQGQLYFSQIKSQKPEGSDSRTQSSTSGSSMSSPAAESPIYFRITQEDGEGDRSSPKSAGNTRFLPAIRETNSSVSMGSEQEIKRTRLGSISLLEPDGRGKKNTMSYEQWVSRKKVEQQKVIDVRKREEERKRMEEEERKLNEKVEENDPWSKRREADRRVSVMDDRGDSSYNHERPVGALREYLHSLKNRKGGTAYGEWLIKRELEMLDEADNRKPLMHT